MESKEIKRKINIANQMIEIHKKANTIFARNAISCWNLKKRNLENKLLQTN